jgi:DNA-binding MarR family transcriptional regulator
MKILRLDASLWMNVSVALRSMDLVYGRAIDGLNLSIIEWYIVRLRLTADGQHPSDLAQLVGRKPTAFTPILDSLQRKQFVIRRPDTADRRAVRVHLTEEGRKLRRRIQLSADDVEGAIRRVATDEEWAAFRRILSQLVDMNDGPAGDGS